jgi:sporulation protein YlmC with PRC-barrel domain
VSEAFRLGSAVVGRDGALGELTRIVIDPATSEVTHLVVKPRFHRHGRLVPVRLVAAGSTHEIALSVSASEFKVLDPAEEAALPEESPADWGAPPMPPQAEVITGGGVGGGYEFGSTGVRAVMRDRVPAGEIEILHGDHVHATDGRVGTVAGLVVDPSDDHVTHILVDEGHLRHRRIAVPLSAVRDVSDVLHLSITKSEVEALPPVDPELRG